ncbi:MULTISPECIES: CitMHS family transporter [Klebsiella]|uniref:CitMHS family transporter n=1 Tax=Klebsiella quasipneumoniae subsp. quasipneumoniae TaxID=1667327 RepID=A0AAW8Y0E9_9ENTR|nr:CitMHS family transporter [Klebsiella quasipneumoniae]AWX87583.1 citrate transporter [Klebsiella quasipneumoniae subsp. quasipneumoniae]ELT0942226.1 CitMHS family transporter [Klebsiella quasipneumoniae]KSY11398.1 citrate transporter [Klebsiella quasipneumoniae]MBC5089929.1 CitMHS family transporter [Klebsiella quasipneumoniae]MBC5127084.1 CitMHS family transporter [Klebsiella quasipneumoniae]
MLSFLGYGMIVVFMILIMTKKLSALTALTIIPILFALIAGFGGEMGEMMIEGLKKVAPTAIMVIFAILYFCTMFDTGLFDPIIRFFLRIIDGDPVKAVMCTALLAAMVSLDGDGSTTYMICVTAMLPLFKRIRLDPLALTCVVFLSGSVTNLLPWGGPLARVSASLKVESSELFIPLIPSMICGLVGVLVLSWYIGIRERRRLGKLSIQTNAHGSVIEEDAESYLPAINEVNDELRRPKMFWLNAALTLALMASLVMELLPLSVLFMVAFAIALLINYPHLDAQRQRIASHAPAALNQTSIFLAAGIFAGILSGTGMVNAMSNTLLDILPQSWGPYLAPITALISLPGTFFMSNDAFYYGVLPVLAEAAKAYGIDPVEIGRASLVGQPVHLLSPLVASTYLLVGLAGVEFSDHQKYTFKWAFLLCMIFLASGLLLGLYPLYSVAS